MSINPSSSLLKLFFKFKNSPPALKLNAEPSRQQFSVKSDVDHLHFYGTCIHPMIFKVNMTYS